MKRGIISKFLGLIFSLLLILSVGVFIYLLLKLDMLPANIFSIVSIVIILITAIACIMQFTKTHVAGSVLSVIVSAILIVGCVYINKTYHVFNGFGNSKVVESYSVVALNGFDKNELKECSDGIFGYNSKVRAEGQSEVIDEITKALNSDLNLVPYNDWLDMADALYEGSVEMIVLNESYRSILEEKYENFNEDTKVIWTQDYETVADIKISDVEATTEPFIVYLAANDDFGTLVSKGRNDVNIIAVVNPVYKKILMITIPRDSYVTLRFEDDTISDYGDKLTHAGTYGIQTSINTIEDMLGINVNYYMKINFSGMIDLVDALDGITVDSDYEFTTYDGTHHFVKGINELNGTDAMYFARERYAFQDGDFQRARDQIKVINAIIDKALSPVILKNYLQIMSSLEGTFETNFPYEDIAALVKMQLETMPSWDIESMNITGTTGWEYCYTYGMSRQLSIVYPDENELNEAISLINMYMNMGETASKSDTSAK